MEKVILDLANSKKRMVVNGIFPKNTTFIIDFYNCYCSMIKFCKFKTFSLETYIVCMKKILALVKNTRRTVIISKNIFEVESSVIRDLLLFYPNVTYFIVEDSFEIKSLNRERDDFFCLAYQAACKERSVIVSNDKFSNFDTLVVQVKPFNVVKIGSKQQSFPFTEEVIKETNKALCKDKIYRTGFSYCV